MRNDGEREWQTRKTRIDAHLRESGWTIVPQSGGSPPPIGDRRALEEYATANGPADYALGLGGHVAGIVEAKKLSLGPQNVLVQAERYARGVQDSPYDFHGLRAPFLYSTNGDQRRPCYRLDNGRGVAT
jgi:type I restriction enzyme R subunit